jgi:hypothetical protein
MKIVIEYKMHKSGDETSTPDWVLNGGWFLDSRNTYIGVISHKNDRNYYVPETVREVTKAELLTRLLIIQDSSPELHKAFVSIEGPLDSSEIESYVNEWWVDVLEAAKGPWPSWIFNKNLNYWEPPVKEPRDDNPHIWDEATTSWKTNKKS